MTEQQKRALEALDYIQPESYEQRVIDAIAYIRGEMAKGFYSPDKEHLEVVMYAAEESLK